MKKLSKEAILLIVFVLIFTLLSIMSPGKFLTGGNLRSICFQIPEFGLFAIAMMLAILTGGINLSVVTSGTLGSVIGALVLSRTYAAGMNAALSITLAVLTVLAISTLCGLLNGFVVSYMGTAAMMTTLGTSILYEGIGLLISRVIRFLNSLPSFTGLATARSWVFRFQCICSSSSRCWCTFCCIERRGV